MDNELKTQGSITSNLNSKSNVQSKLGETKLVVFNTGYVGGETNTATVNIEKETIKVDVKQEGLTNKQDVLTAGSNIKIENNVISNTLTKLSELNNDTGFIDKNTTELNNYYTKNDIYTKNEVDGLIPTKTSQLQNDSGFIDNNTNELANYYLKSDTYTKNEVNTIRDNITTRVDEVSEQSQTALDTANEALEQVTQGLGTSVYVNNDLQTRLDFTSNPQEQINTNISAIASETSARESADSNLQSQITTNTTDITAIKNNTTIIANSNGGFMAGTGASATKGGAMGRNASATDGFSGGSIAVGMVDCIQLGTGVNTRPKTLQIYNDNIYNTNTHTLTVQNATIQSWTMKQASDGSLTFTYRG